MYWSRDSYLCICFIQNGADLYLRQAPTGNTVLHLAASNGFYDICKHLLDLYSRDDNDTCKGIKHIINAFNHDGKTPLVMAADKGTNNILQHFNP